MENTEPEMIKVTDNGEITYQEGIFYVWDESYSTVICETYYEDIARLALKTYVKKYLT